MDTEETLTYGELQLVAGAIEASITPQNADPDVQYADDAEFDILYPDPELSFKTNMADLPLIIQEMIFANKIDDNGVLIRSSTDKPPYFAVDFISGRALREMEPAAKMYAKIVALSNAAVKGEEIPQDQQISVTDAIDVMIRWFCLLFGNQFGPDDVLDGYPVDHPMHDIALALMAVQTQTTEILSEFPTKAAKEPASPPKTAEEIPLF